MQRLTCHTYKRVRIQWRHRLQELDAALLPHKRRADTVVAVSEASNAAVSHHGNGEANDGDVSVFAAAARRIALRKGVTSLAPPDADLRADADLTGGSEQVETVPPRRRKRSTIDLVLRTKTDPTNIDALDKSADALDASDAAAESGHNSEIHVKGCETATITATPFACNQSAKRQLQPCGQITLAAHTMD